PTADQSGAALEKLKAKAPTDTAAQDDARYERIQTAKGLNQPVSPEDAAWAKAYVQRKTLGPSATSAAADARQATAEAFTRAEAGRKVLSTDVEKPYLEAREKADTLRTVIAAAQNGNMEAASVTPLLATLGLTTMEGVKRINSTELQQVSGAGSLLTRIQGAAGKLTAGQPLPKKLQD